MLRRDHNAGTLETIIRACADNFAESYHLASIKTENKIYTAAGDGSKPFIAASDIAAVARVALIDEIPHNTDHYITGPASLTYDEVAQTLTEVLGRKIEHVKLSRAAFEQKLLDVDFSSAMAEYMVDLDVKVSQRGGGDITDIVQKRRDISWLLATGYKSLPFGVITRSVMNVPGMAQLSV
nr:putative oxidoreductase yesf [Quercus suber]